MDLHGGSFPPCPPPYAHICFEEGEKIKVAQSQTEDDLSKTWSSSMSFADATSSTKTARA